VTPKPSIIYATRIGGKTIDQDFCGGNPFATALLDAVARQPGSLRMLLGETRAATAAATDGLQRPVWKLQPGHGRWKIAADASRSAESRLALVLVVSDYESAELGFLAGAAHDERRVAAMLAFHGFSVIQGVGRGRASILTTLRSFARQTARADVALVYCTGHGAHTPAGTMLLPRDYPHRHGYARKALLSNAVPIAELGDACQASATNIVFFAGCRTHGPTHP
jgi:hypothetical protein